MEHQKTNSNLQSQHDDWGEVHNQLIDVQRQKKIQKKSLDISDESDPAEHEANEIAKKVANGESSTISGASGVRFNRFENKIQLKKLKDFSGKNPTNEEIKTTDEYKR